MRAPETAALLAIAYLVGSLSPAYLFGRAIGGVDLRDVGSRNLGARNAARTLGRRIGAIVWLLDMAKGAAAVVLARSAGAGMPAVVACGAAAVCGHNWPAYYGFRGGRGASTAMGATFVLLPLEMTVGLALWVLVSHVSKSFYLGGLVAYPATTALALLLGGGGFRAWSPILVAAPLIARHMPDIVAHIRARRLRLP